MSGFHKPFLLDNDPNSRGSYAYIKGSIRAREIGVYILPYDIQARLRINFSELHREKLVLVSRKGSQWF